MSQNMTDPERIGVLRRAFEAGTFDDLRERFRVTSRGSVAEAVVVRAMLRRARGIAGPFENDALCVLAAFGIFNEDARAQTVAWASVALGRRRR